MQKLVLSQTNQFQSIMLSRQLLVVSLALGAINRPVIADHLWKRPIVNFTQELAWFDEVWFTVPQWVLGGLMRWFLRKNWFVKLGVRWRALDDQIDGVGICFQVFLKLLCIGLIAGSGRQTWWANYQLGIKIVDLPVVHNLVLCLLVGRLGLITLGWLFAAGSVDARSHNCWPGT